MVAAYVTLVSSPSVTVMNRVLVVVIYIVVVDLFKLLDDKTAESGGLPVTAVCETLAVVLTTAVPTMVEFAAAVELVAAEDKNVIKLLNGGLGTFVGAAVVLAGAMLLPFT